MNQYRAGTNSGVTPGRWDGSASECFRKLTSSCTEALGQVKTEHGNHDRDQQQREHGHLLAADCRANRHLNTGHQRSSMSRDLTAEVCPPQPQSVRAATCATNTTERGFTPDSLPDFLALALL